MAQVVCDIVTKGFRDSERSVGVRDTRGHRQFLRVAEHFLTFENGKYYLPVGLVMVNYKEQAALVELPHEADSGANRLWVPFSSLLEPVRSPL
jgi:hypothetical protein